MKDSFRDLFTFSSGECKGVIVLILIIIIIGSINLVLVLKHPAEILEDYPAWMDDSAVFSGPGNRVPVESDTTHDPVADFMTVINEPFHTDPNTATVDELVRLGLGLKICRTIVNYRSKGGRFYVPADLKKIYGMTPEMYDRILPRILIGHPGMDHSDQQLGQYEAPTAVDINHADSARLVSLPGIGPVLASRIIKYRALLGGYYSRQQIKEVYGIDEDVYEKIAERLVADTLGLKKININSATEQEIANHPYVGKYVAAGIIRYRAGVTRINSIDELKINGLLTAENFERIKNYLRV